MRVLNKDGTVEGHQSCQHYSGCNLPAISKIPLEDGYDAYACPNHEPAHEERLDEPAYLERLERYVRYYGDEVDVKVPDSVKNSNGGEKER